MKNNSDYYSQRNKNNIETTNRIIDEELPSFCLDYFMGIDSMTSPLTRLNYAHDLKIFFDFMCKKRYGGKKTVKEISLIDLENVTNNDIEYFLVYLSNYEYCGTEHTCNERAKARKLSSVRAMFKYFFNKGQISVNNSAKVSSPKLHEKPYNRLFVELWRRYLG